jgi:methylmalonyl-CoA/ethylmalonyl-CoA epimerase
MHIDHVGIAAWQLDQGSAFYRSAGASWLGDAAIPDQGVAVRLLQLGEDLIEVIAPLGGMQEGSLHRFLARRGPGLHHLAVRVASVEDELRRLSGLGAQLIDRQPRPGRPGTKVAFVHPQATGGTLLELVELAEEF